MATPCQLIEKTILIRFVHGDRILKLPEGECILIHQEASIFKTTHSPRIPHGGVGQNPGGRELRLHCHCENAQSATQIRIPKPVPFCPCKKRGRLCGHQKHFLCAIHDRDAPNSRDGRPLQGQEDRHVRNDKILALPRTKLPKVLVTPPGREVEQVVDVLLATPGDH